MSKISSLRRDVAIRPEKRTIHVLTEGEETETGYVAALRSLDEVRRSVSITIEIGKEHAVPLKLVEEAMRIAKKPEIDTVWCLADIEAPAPHPNIDNAIALAQKHPKVKIAFTNPCFELWLLLHDRDITGYRTTRAMESDVQQLRAVSGKKITDAQYFMERRNEAITRAAQLRQIHLRNSNRIPHNNPSSDMDLFLADIFA